MTILNAWIEPERALIGVDSEMVLPNGERYDTTKLFPLVHLNAVLSGRGSGQFLRIIVGAAYLVPGGFDGLVDAMDEILGLMFATFINQPRAALESLETAPDPQQTVMAVGWSRRASRIVGVEWTQLDRAIGFVKTEIKTSYMAPWGESSDPALALSRFSVVEMVRLARLQVEAMRRDSPAIATGGRFFVAEVMRGKINMAQVCHRLELDNPGEQHDHR